MRKLLTVAVVSAALLSGGIASADTPSNRCSPGPGGLVYGTGNNRYSVCVAGVGALTTEGGFNGGYVVVDGDQGGPVDNGYIGVYARPSGDAGVFGECSGEFASNDLPENHKFDPNKLTSDGCFENSPV